jgi:hypothetical protein
LIKPAAAMIAVPFVVEYRNVEELPQPLFDDEAFRGADVLEVDAAPALAEQLDAVDDLVGVLGRHFEVDRIDVGEALEQDRLAFHHRLCRQRAAIAEPEDGRAVGDDGDEIALGGVVVGAILGLRDRQHRDGDARRVGERQIALGRHRLGGHHFELAGTALAMEQQRFLVGERRSRAAAVVFRRHLNPLLEPAPDGPTASDGPWNARCRRKSHPAATPPYPRHHAGADIVASRAAGCPNRR